MKKLSDKQILDIANKLHVAYKLKRTLRYSTKRNLKVHSESVAEHIFALFFLAEYFMQHEKIGPSLNIEKLHRMLLFHDFGEIKDGDIPYHLKTSDDEKRERLAAKEVFKSLPRPLQKISYDSWNEYESLSSPEARFAFAIDKIEPLFELHDPVNEKSMKQLKFTYDMNIVKKRKATEKFPVMRRFIEVLSNDMVKRHVFWTPPSNRNQRKS